MALAIAHISLQKMNNGKLALFIWVHLVKSRLIKIIRLIADKILTEEMAQKVHKVQNKISSAITFIHI